jgi:hypothetical protein
MKDKQKSYCRYLRTAEVCFLKRTDFIILGIFFRQQV